MPGPATTRTATIRAPFGHARAKIGTSPSAHRASNERYKMRASRLSTLESVGRVHLDGLTHAYRRSAIGSRSRAVLSPPSFGLAPVPRFGANLRQALQNLARRLRATFRLLFEAIEDETFQVVRK